MDDALRFRQIIVAHGGVVYRFTASGRALAPDQKAALTSLHFVSIAKGSGSATR